MSEKKLLANRMNARKSTGPRSSSGKAKSSRNALRHGLLAQSPIISGVESRKQWEGHRDAVLESFGPLDYPHKLLAIQLAVSLWNLWRADRIEAKMAETAVAVAESELGQRTDKPSDPATARVEAQRESMILGLLNELFSETNDEEGVDRHLAPRCGLFGGSCLARSMFFTFPVFQTTTCNSMLSTTGHLAFFARLPKFMLLRRD